MKVKTILFLVFLQLVICVSYAQWDSVGQNQRGKNAIPVYVSALCVYQANLVMGMHTEGYLGFVPLTTNLFQWNGMQWDTITRGVENPAALLVYNGNLVVLGNYPAQPSYIGQWNGSEWGAVGPELWSSAQWGPYLSALGEYNGNLYIAAVKLGGYGTSGSPGLLKLDSGEWSGVSFPDYMVPLIYTMAVYQNKLYLGGTFNISGLHNIATWNDTVLAPVGAGIDSVNAGGGVYSMIVWNGKLYVGGLFDSAGGQAAHNVAVWDGNNWSALGTGVHGDVGSFAIYHDTLIVGGIFDSAGGVRCNNIAKWDGTSWHAMGRGITSASKGLEPGVDALCVYNGALYVGGQFDSAGGIYAVNIARWGIPNSTDTAIYTGALKIYPNPSNGMFTFVIASEAKQSLSSIEIYNVLGQKIYTANLSPGLNKINLYGKASGMYIYKATSTNGEVREGKLVIEK